MRCSPFSPGFLAALILAAATAPSSMGDGSRGAARVLFPDGAVVLIRASRDAGGSSGLNEYSLGTSCGAIGFVERPAPGVRTCSFALVDRDHWIAQCLIYDRIEGLDLRRARVLATARSCPLTGACMDTTWCDPRARLGSLAYVARELEDWPPARKEALEATLRHEYPASPETTFAHFLREAGGFGPALEPVEVVDSHEVGRFEPPTIFPSLEDAHRWLGAVLRTHILPTAEPAHATPSPEERVAFRKATRMVGGADPMLAYAYAAEVGMETVIAGVIGTPAGHQLEFVALLGRGDLVTVTRAPIPGQGTLLSRWDSGRCQLYLAEGAGERRDFDRNVEALFAEIPEQAFAPLALLLSAQAEDVFGPLRDSLGGSLRAVLEPYAPQGAPAGELVIVDDPDGSFLDAIWPRLLVRFDDGRRDLAMALRFAAEKKQ
jgi:hypothetical protein